MGDPVLAFGRFVVLAVCSLALPLVGVPPAVGEPTAAAGGGIRTDRPSLVNDPAADTSLFSHTQNSVALTVAGPNLVAAYNDNGSSEGIDDPHFTGYSVSGDGGRTWTDQGAVSDGPLPDYGSPSLATDELSGRVYLATEGLSAGRNSLLLFRSDDDGASFAAPVVATRAAQAGPAPLRPDVAVDNFPGPGQGRVYLGWSYLFSSNDGARLAVSDNGGTTWSPPSGVLVDPAVQQPSRPDLVVSPDHCLHFVYLRATLGFANNSIDVRTSCDGGQTFRPRVRIAELSTGNSSGDLRINGQFGSNSYPQAAVNPVTGALYVVYNDLTAAQGADVFLTSSTDGGATWSEPAVVSTDRTGSDQFSPTVAVTGDGTRVMVGFYDRRSDPFNLDIQRWGRLASVNLATNTLRWIPDDQLGPSFPPIRDTSLASTEEFSEFEAMTSNDTTFFTAWTDNRDGDAFSAYQSDIRSATIPTRGGGTELAVEVTGDPQGPVGLGEQYRYTATVTNTSSRPAVNVFARTTLPIGTKFVSATTTGPGLCYRLARQVSCRLGILPAGTSRTVTVLAQALRPGPLPRVVTATTTTSENNSTNNAAASTTVTPDATAVSTFSTGDIAVEIPTPPNQPTYVPIEVPAGSPTALDLEVLLRLNHRDDQTLDIALLAPDGTEVALSSNNSFSLSSNYGVGPVDCSGTPTVFDDAAAMSIVDGTAPFLGTFRPESELADALGQAAAGTWRLRIIDQDPFWNRGIVGCVQLRITHTA